MAEHTDENVTRLLQAARGLVEAYRQQTTSQDDFERLAEAVDAFGGGTASRPERPAEATAAAGLSEVSEPPVRQAHLDDEATGDQLGPQADQAVRMARADTAPGEGDRREGEEPPGPHPTVA